MEYYNGFPKQPGWYDVQVNGVDDRLLFRFCPSCGTYEWKDINGIKVPPENVVWTGTANAYP